MNIRKILENHRLWINSDGNEGELADLRGANLQKANLCEANLRGANLQKADLWWANLRGADLRGVDLCEAILRGADLCEANLRGADLRGANLQKANLCEANLRGANLQKADLRGADLRGADLWRADLREAKLRGAKLRGADLREADLREAELPKKTFVIQGEAYFLMITNGDDVRVGCQCHSVEQWRRFTKEEVAGMDGKKALKFYPRLLEIIDFYCGKEVRNERNENR